jgi:hypothetical protein
MNKLSHSPELQRLIDSAFEDAKSIHSRFPHQLLLALADDAVQQVLDRRFASGQVLTKVATLPVHADTGLVPLYFTFAPSAAVNLAGTSILIQVDHRCDVTIADEDFVPARPNPVIDSKSVKRTAPLALATARSGGERLRVDPAVANDRRRLHAEMLVHHGLLSQVDMDAAIGGGTLVILDTECTLTTTTGFEDTILGTVIVTDPNGNVIDRYQEIELDPSTEEQTSSDDSTQMTVNELLDQLGRPGI